MESITEPTGSASQRDRIAAIGSDLDTIACRLHSFSRSASHIAAALDDGDANKELVDLFYSASYVLAYFAADVDLACTHVYDLARTDASGRTA